MDVSPSACGSEDVVALLQTTQFTHHRSQSSWELGDNSKEQLSQSMHGLQEGTEHLKKAMHLEGLAPSSKKAQAQLDDNEMGSAFQQIHKDLQLVNRKLSMQMQNQEKEHTGQQAVLP